MYFPPVVDFKKDRFLLACSGGIDSTYLFYQLKQQTTNFIVGFFDYETETNATVANYDVIVVQKFCQKYQIPFFSAKCTQKLTAANFEHLARQARFSFLFDLYQQHKCNWLVVAHNLDDSICTQIIRKHRQVNDYGTSFHYQAFNVNYLKPLLLTPRKEILTWLLVNKINFNFDQTNLDPERLRNKYFWPLSTFVSLRQKRKIFFWNLRKYWKNHNQINNFKKLTNFLNISETFPINCLQQLYSKSLKLKILKHWLQSQLNIIDNLSFSKAKILNLLIFINANKTKKDPKAFLLSSSINLIYANGKLSYQSLTNTAKINLHRNF